MRDAPADLSACDVEPIHIPGAIQPHGALVAMKEPDLVVFEVSANVGELFGTAPERTLGRRLPDVLGTEAGEAVARALRERDPTVANPLRLELGGRVFDGLLHRNDAGAILELEPQVDGTPAVDCILGHVLGRLQRARSVDDLCAVAAEQLRTLTGFERVMVYRFDADGHGEVVAEDRARDVEAFLGHHYPASDIPRQARRLYLLNPIRVIPDARCVAVPLVTAADAIARAPLDLTLASLRAVAPVHLEYLANMGVRASMSASLVRGDRLWGLFACHHRSPRKVPFALRSACEIFARVVSLELEALEEIGTRVERDALRGAESALVDAMRGSPEGWAGGLLARPELLLRVVKATGVAIHDEHGTRTVGDVPSPPHVSTIIAWLSSLKGDLLATCSVPTELPSVGASADVASGLLAVRIPGAAPAYVVWFRREVARTRTWGGDPSKAVDEEGARLHPRRSFATWTELVRGTSLQWTRAEIETAESLARRAIEVDLQRQIARASQAIGVRDDVVAVLSHDLRSPLSVIELGVRLLRKGLGDAPALHVELDRIERARGRMTTLVSDLLDLATIEAGRFHVKPTPCRARAVVDDAVALSRPLAEERGVRVDRAEVQDVPLLADRERLLQVLENLICNAIKFAAEGGTVRVSAARNDGFTRFEVHDEGPGIPPEQLAHLFDRYWRAPSARRTVGSGLGLFIAKGLVEAHGGQIWAESAMGRGSTFCFTVPSGPEASTAP
ncbi:MAG TPA: ATP-binding protein [Polyangiaceae bacterium]|nr:ATP-binding protein [Polyangiaceae bacterium]